MDIFNAISNNNLDKVKYILDKREDVDINAKNNYGYTALISANYNGCTALILASYNRYTEILKYINYVINFKKKFNLSKEIVPKRYFFSNKEQCKNLLLIANIIPKNGLQLIIRHIIVPLFVYLN